MSSAPEDDKSRIVHGFIGMSIQEAEHELGVAQFKLDGLSDMWEQLHPPKSKKFMDWNEYNTRLKSLDDQIEKLAMKRSTMDPADWERVLYDELPHASINQRIHETEREKLHLLWTKIPINKAKWDEDCMIIRDRMSELILKIRMLEIKLIYAGAKQAGFDFSKVAATQNFHGN